jgi:hypothetical protein
MNHVQHAIILHRHHPTVLQAVFCPRPFTAQHFAPCTNDGNTYLISESCMATNYPYQVTTVRTIIIIIIINRKDHAILCDIGAQQ